MKPRHVVEKHAVKTHMAICFGQRRMTPTKRRPYETFIVISTNATWMPENAAEIVLSVPLSVSRISFVTNGWPVFRLD